MAATAATLPPQLDCEPPAQQARVLLRPPYLTLTSVWQPSNKQDLGLHRSSNVAGPVALHGQQVRGCSEIPTLQRSQFALQLQSPHLDQSVLLRAQARIQDPNAPTSS